MNDETKLTSFVQAHTSPPRGMMFYHSLESVQSDNALLGYISVIERAWQELNLAGVLCLDNRPILYLKEYNRPFSSLERITIQRRFWNQGVANLLVLADPASVYIYSGLAKPQKDQSDEGIEDSLIEKLKKADYVQQIQSFYHGLATGHYYEHERNQKYFDQSQSVDSWLLDNLRDLRNALTEGEECLEAKTAHAFIGRVLFLCYLLDRGIFSVGAMDAKRTGTMMLAEILETSSSHKLRINYLYDKLFSDLKERFNGNMFDQNLDIEKRLIKPVHLDKLILFLGGHNVANGQRSLGFWPYDFKMISVETISAVYQDFLGKEDREKQQKHGAFYTPRFLAEMVVDEAINNHPDSLNWSFLDPSCGSGIFLVIIFNRLATRWIYSQKGTPHYATKAKALQEILARQIRGVDVEETACRIACFSLYLAYLNFFNPPDIQSHIEKTGKPLPKLLNYGDMPDRPEADIPVIHKADFLADKTLAGETFDCIIGNPPWEGRGSKQLAVKFIQKVPQLLRQKGTGCLLLPSKIIQNQTDAFQSEWLRKVALEKVFQLADYRFLLFQEALCPAIIARFKNEPPDLKHDKVELVAPKFNRDGLRQGIITVNPSARSWISIIDILSAAESGAAPVVWKRRLWGTPRDQKLLDLLHSMPSLSDYVDLLSELRVKRIKRTKRWVAGQGIKPWKKESKTESDRTLKPIIWPFDTPFIDTQSKSVDLLLLTNDTIAFGDRLRKKEYRTDVLYSQPPKELFLHPMVLVSQGFGKVAYSDFDVLFQDSLQSIAGPREDADLLMFLTAYLRSDLARYFLFHTSANWGSERDKVHLNELLRVPFPLPGDEFGAPNGQRIVKQVAKRMAIFQEKLQETQKKFISTKKRASLFGEVNSDVTREWNRERKRLINELQNELNPLIYRYFGLTEQEIILIEDTIHVFAPSSTPPTWRSPQAVTLELIENSSVEPYASQGLKAYCNTLTATLNDWAQAERSKYLVCAEGGIDNQTGLVMVTIRLSQTATAYQEKDISRPLARVLKQFYKSSARRHGMLLYERDVFFFSEGCVYIVRPNNLINWTRTAALNDAAKIYGEIAVVQRGDDGK